MRHVVHCHVVALVREGPQPEVDLDDDKPDHPAKAVPAMR